MPSESGFQISESAAENYQRFNPVIMAPFVNEVIRRANIAPGHAVLDIACGTGLLTRAAAAIAGPTGRVAGLDLNSGMLAVARALPTPPGAPITWHEGSALDLPFADGEFRAVLCQQGIQFFPDLEQAIREMARVAAPGARIVVSFWASLEQQTYFQAQLDGLRRAIGAAAAPMQAAFGLDPARVRVLLSAAGCRDVRADLFTPVVVLPSMEQFAAAQVSTLPVGPAFAALDAAQQEDYVRGMQRVLTRYRTPTGTYHCPIASWVVTATR